MRLLDVRKSLSILFLATSFGGIPAAHADTPVSWANTNSSGNWSDPTQWSPQVSPDGAYAVTLPAGSEVVTLDISPTIDTLTVNQGAYLQTSAGTSLTTGFLNNSGSIYFTSGGTLTVNGDVTMDGAYYYGMFIGSSNVSIAGNVTNSEQFITGYSGGATTVNVSGTFTNTANGSLSLTSSGDIVNVNALNNQGSVNVASGTTLNITGGGAGVTDVSSNSSYYLVGNFNVVNGSVITSAIANLATIEGNLFLLNGQTYQFGSLTMGGPYYNGVNIGQGTTVSITGDIINSESFNTGYRGGNNTVNVSGTFTNTANGSLSLTSSGDIVNVNALNNQGSVNVGSGTTLNITGGGQEVADVVATSSYSLSGDFNVINGGVATSALANLANVEGNLALLSGQTYNFGSLMMGGPYYNGINIGQGTTVSIAGNVTNSEQFITGYRGGGNTVNVSGTFTNTANGQLSLTSSGDVVNVNALNNQGSVGVTAGALLTVGSGIFSENSGYEQIANGTFDEIIGGASTYGVVNINGPISLDGTLEISLANGFVPSIGESFTFLSGTPDDLTGQYSSIVAQGFAGGEWQVVYNDAAGAVTLTAVVPEPATLSLIGFAAISAIGRRRRCV